VVFAPSLVEVEIIGLLPLGEVELVCVSLFGRGGLLSFGYGSTPRL